MGFAYAASAAALIWSLTWLGEGRAMAQGSALDDAAALWRPGVSVQNQGPKGGSLIPRGDIVTGLAADVGRSTAAAGVAELRGGYYDVERSDELNLGTQAITILLRARSPGNRWDAGLVSKHGGHQRLSFNLFAISLRGPGQDIGFEVGTEVGMGQVTFRAERVGPDAWHDLVARYDGQTMALFCDATLLAERPWQGTLRTSDVPVMVGAEAYEGADGARPMNGTFIDTVAIWDRALTDREVAALSDQESIEIPPPPPPQTLAELGSPLHYRPADGGYVGDCIPFFHSGTYHVFYLKRGFGGTPWAHLVSDDLVHWEELPIALPLGNIGDPDGGDCWTGSVIEHEGTFHIFYTGHNEAAERSQTVCHATSPDLVTWTKDPANPVLVPDPRYFGTADFRDPYVFWNEAEQCFWMTITGREPDCPVPASGCLGLATSRDLVRWELQPPVWTPRQFWTPECSDLFPAGGRWYLLYSTGVTCIAHAPGPRGPWQAPPDERLDEPRNYAIKRLFDGRRHIAFGWVASRAGETDGGGWEWGGHMCIPRELLPQPDGSLYVRPVAEVMDAFSRDLLDEAALAQLAGITGEWSVEGRAVTGSKPDGRAYAELSVPDSYLLTTEVRFDNPAAKATFVLRAGDDRAGGYAVRLEPSHHRVSIRHWSSFGPTDVEMERPVDFPDPRRTGIPALPEEPGRGDARPPEGDRWGGRLARPLPVSIFVQGTILEVFVGDQVGVAGRLYDRPSGKLALVADNGTVEFGNLRVRGRPDE